MGVLINSSDFVGDLAVSLNKFNEQSFKDFIIEQEVYYLYLIVGEELGDLILLTPTDPDYVKILLPFSFQRGLRVHQSYGLKKTIAMYIRSIWLHKTQSKVTLAGVGTGAGDNTLISSQSLFIGWNDATKSARSVQQYCMDNRSKYSEFNRTDIPYNHNA